MAVVQLSNGDLWIWSPVALTDELASSVGKIGSVRYIVSPNKIHHLFLQQWAERWPDARLYAPPGLSGKKPEIQFTAELQDEPDPAWGIEIDQVIFHGSIAMEEVVFFHRASRTVIICDLIQRHRQEKMSGWKGKIMQLDGLVGDQGSTPREWRASFLRRAPARAARQKVLNWQPSRLLIAHGECSQSEATEIVRNALSWI